MSSNDFAIQVTNVSKRYEIYATPRDRLKQFVLPRLQSLAGQPSKQYFREFWALKDVSFEIKKGETVGIIGRNGSGKSTLLQMICGTLNPTSGSIQTNGRIAALLELGSGFNPEFTGRENVYMNAAVLGLSREEIDARFDDITTFADIGQFIDQPIKTYSSGMVVRIAFATAVHVEPDILVVDEALAVGDTAFQQKCLNRIRQMQRSGVSILLVTHSNNTLVEYCDRGVFINSGQLMLDGPCREVVKAYADDLVEEEGGVTFIPQASTNTPREQTDHPPIAASPSDPSSDNTMLIHIEVVRLFDEKGKDAAAFEYGSLVQIELTLRVHSPIVQPCFGIQITSSDGIALWSANTQLMGIPLEPLAAGTHKLKWNLHADFSGNRYVIALGAGHLIYDEYKRLHRLDYAGHFDVMPLQASGSGWLAPRAVFCVPYAVTDQRSQVTNLPNLLLQTDFNE
jgi:lipopolysaccharide transport system ATP-binding protein